MDRLNRRVILITGSTGIAAATAGRCAAEGASVFVVSRSADHAKALADGLDADGAQVGWATADLADADAADTAVAAAVARFGRIDGVFAVAGGSGRRFGDGPIHELTPEGWDGTLELNLRSQAMTCRAVVRQMLAQPPNESGTRGSILLMGSVTATDPVPRDVRHARLCRGQGRHDRADDDHGSDVRLGRHPGQCRRPVADRHADGDAGVRRPTDPRLCRPEATVGRRDDGSARGGARRGLPPVRRVAGRDRAGAQGRWWVVGRVGVANVTFVRSVLGDVDPAELGITYAHEHLVIDGGRMVEMSPDFLLTDVDRLTAELRDAAAVGLTTAIDALPADCGRNPSKLAELSRMSGVRIVAATGLHHEKYYRPSHWSLGASENELADLFVADVDVGIDERDYGGPLVRRTEVRAGIVKVGGSEGGPSARDLPIFRAAAATHARTGVPIHTHCEAGTGALEQIRVLTDAGVPAEHISLSHVDKVVDPGYHREILATGAFAVYDQAFRWGERDNGTLLLLESAASDGRLGQVMLGMDAARQGYLGAFGGSPGLPYLLTTFSDQLEARGLGPEIRHRLFVENPARAFAFAEVDR